MKLPSLLIVTLLMAFAPARLDAGQDPSPGSFAATGIPSVPLPSEPVIYDTAEGQRIRVRVVADDLRRPWGLALLSDDRMLVTEREGRLRLIHQGVLDPTPIQGVPEVYTGVSLAGLMDIEVHPDFTENRWVYLTYSKPTQTGATIALARGRLDGHHLSDVTDLFVAEADGPGIAASRLLFAPDGLLYMTVGGAINAESTGKLAQDPASHIGKVLRLRDDGTVPPDNPMVDRPGYRPEIFSLGHRNQLGLAFHPETGALWASENAPMGGDEVNVVLPGRNYGWPVVSYGREYYGVRVSDQPWQAGMEPPEIVWIPSIAPAGMVFYTGDRFPAWKGNLFVGSMMTGRIERTGHLERIAFNRQGFEQRREWLLADLRQRIRDVQQGADGLLYILTDGASLAGQGPRDAAVLRIEPVE